MPIEDLTVDYTRCRTIGHAWFEADTEWDTSFPGTQMTLRCERCMTERREVWSRTTGDLVYRHYNYPDGYIQEWGGNFPTKDDFRLALLAIQNRSQRKPRNGTTKKAG